MKIFKELFEQNCSKMSLGDYFTMRLPDGTRVYVCYCTRFVLDDEDFIESSSDIVKIRLTDESGTLLFAESMRTNESSLFDDAWGLVREATGCKI